MILPGTNVDCSSEMISGGILFNLFASALEIILYITLQRLIGQNWLKDIGFWTFGTKTINVPFFS
jgi:hypothetical protein